MTFLKRFGALLLALAVVMPVMAQFRIGPRVGVNINELHFSQDAFNSDNRAGFTAGLMTEFTVPVIDLGLDASIMYVKRNSEWMTANIPTSEGVKMHSDYIEIPINLKYKLGLPIVGGLVKPFVTTGPSFAFLTSKKAISAAVEKKSTDIAWNFGFGVELFKHVQVAASYGIGMTKAFKAVGAAQSGDSSIDGKNRYWTVTAAYLF